MRGRTSNPIVRPNRLMLQRREADKNEESETGKKPESSARAGVFPTHVIFRSFRQQSGA